ncbi:unnamed protein product, partial [Choristocarpus tenellus]
ATALAPRAHLALATIPALAYSQNLPSLEKTPSPYEHGVHRSDAEELIAKFPVIEVDGEVALCDGVGVIKYCLMYNNILQSNQGGGALGHPLEYIKLRRTDNDPVACIYCGLRYKMKEH